MAQERQIEYTLMGFPVRTNDACSVDSKYHMEVFHANIVDQLVISPLQEGGIHRKDRGDAAFCQPCRKCCAMLFRNGNIKEAFRESLLEFLEACTATHSRRNAGNLWILFADFQHFITKNRRPAFAALGKGFACFQIKGRNTMIIPGTFLRMRVAFALDRLHMDENRTVHFLYAFEHFDQIGQIMSIYRANVFEAHLLKQRTSGQQHFGFITYMLQCLISAFPNDRYVISELLYRFLPATILLTGTKIIQMLAHCPYIGIDGHLIIIQNNNQSGMVSAGIIHGFIRQTACHGTIPNDSNHMFLTTHQVSCFCQTQCCRNRCGAVSCRKGITITFIGFWEAAETIQLTQGVKTVFSARQNLMDICLMAYIPYDFIRREVKTIFQSHRQFHHAQIRRQMTAGLGNLLQKELPQFLAEEFQLAFIQFFDIFSGMYLI